MWKAAITARWGSNWQRPARTDFAVTFAAHLVPLPIRSTWGRMELLRDLVPSARTALEVSPRWVVESAPTAKKVADLLDLDFRAKDVWELPERPSAAESRTWAENLTSEPQETAFFSDAGSPFLADPIGKVLDALADRGVKLVPHHGPTSLVSAIGAVGFPCEDFYFAGFLPRKDQERESRLRELKVVSTLIVLLETPYRLEPFLQAVTKVFSGESRAALVFDLDGPREQVVRGRLPSLGLKHRDFPKAPFVFLLENRSASDRPGSVHRRK